MPDTNPECYVCVPFGTGPACARCRELSAREREARLTDTLLTEIEIEEKNDTAKTR